MQDILRKNIAIFFILEIAVYLLSMLSSDERSLGFAILTGLIILLMFLINLILAIRSLLKVESRKSAPAYFLSCLVILLIGFPTCFLGTALVFH